MKGLLKARASTAARLIYSLDCGLRIVLEK